MVFETLGLSLYDFLKKNHYRGFPMNFIQSFFKQILQSIGFLHDMQLTHTDLKPENILLVNPNYKKLFEDEQQSDQSDSYHSIIIPVSDKIKIIDFGSATFAHEHHGSIINTRQYRAPEVILECMEWNEKSDIWGIACIMMELYTGNIYFSTHESYEHLSMIEKSSGNVPHWMAIKSKTMSKHFKVDDEYYFNKYHSYFDWPKYASSYQSEKRVKNMQLIKKLVPKEQHHFQDLLYKMMEIDPKKRISCKEALQHEFFKIKY